MAEIWLQHQRIDKAVGAGFEVSHVIVRQSQVDNRAHVVWSQVNRKLVGLNALLSLQQLGAGSTILVPQ